MVVPEFCVPASSQDATQAPQSWLVVQNAPCWAHWPVVVTSVLRGADPPLRANVAARAPTRKIGIPISKVLWEVMMEGLLSDRNMCQEIGQAGEIGNIENPVAIEIGITSSHGGRWKRNLADEDVRDKG